MEKKELAELNRHNGERLTYARRRLLEIIRKRKLRDFCERNGLSNITYFNLAYGKIRPTYRVMSESCNVIPVIEWLFYTDEKLPYEPMIVPVWKGTAENSLLFQNHYDEYMQILKRLGIAENLAAKIFDSRKNNPAPEILRSVCEIANPVDFFRDTEGKEEPVQNCNAERGDIIILDGELYFVISVRKKEGLFAYIAPVRKKDYEDGIKLEGTRTNGVVIPEIVMHKLSKNQQDGYIYIESCPEETTHKVLNMFRRILR